MVPFSFYVFYYCWTFLKFTFLDILIGGLADLLKEKDVFPYEEIPNFPTSTVPGHAGRMVIGLLEDVPVICMQGR